MGVSDIIAGFIDEMLSDTGGIAELRRAELASRFNCVPSQINYVISTRFSPEHGYIVESRRGGGGYIRIRRIAVESEMLIMHTVNAIGDRVDPNSAAALVANLRQNEAITNDIMNKLERGVTLVPVLGAYERTEKEMIMVTMDSRNYRDLLEIVKEHDKQAFMITDNISEVHGQGFTYDTGTV